MRRVLGALLAVALPLFADAPSQSILGFSDPAKEHALESRFDAVMDPSLPRAWMQRLTAHPHHIGSPYGKENAEYIASLFRSFGFDTKIERFDVLFPTPKLRMVELVAPTQFKAALNEPALPEDTTSTQTSEMLPPYNAYSIDGDVTAELVYVNYGVPADYEVLARNGIDVKGKIVIARYGQSWRGIKPKVAAEHGAVGCILYSDPRDDGYFQGDVYPRGGYRSEGSAQRGSVADMPVYSGDPLTPGVGATAGAKRLDLRDVKVLTKIPVLPISYGDALPLLRALGGPVAPEAWRGALPLTYHLGSGPAKVHLQLAFDWNMVPAYDVIARMAGTDRADEWVIRGNHHDAWVHGAADPISGLVAMLSEARGVGELVKKGWKPRRTIIYAAWDGEEPGLLGSTEWVETHLAELQQHAVVYINSDSTTRGFFDAGGSHTLQRFVTEVARDVEDPERHVSVLERRKASDLVAASTPEERAAIRELLYRLDALGSGSDFTPFLQHAGIAALNVSYGGEEQYGVYHSMYDSFDHFTRFDDPQFTYSVAQAKTTGRMMLRLAGADSLPFEAATFASATARYAEEVVKLADSMRAGTDEENRQLDERTVEIAADLEKPFVAPPRRERVPFLDFAPLQNAVAHLKDAAAVFDRMPQGPARDSIARRLEQALTTEQGLPDRPWYRHQVYAPGFYTGYGVKTLPGVREAIEERKWSEANREVVAVAAVLERYASILEQKPASPAGGASASK